MPTHPGSGRSPAVEAVCSKWGSRIPQVALLSAINSRFAAVRGTKWALPVEVFLLARIVGARVIFESVGSAGLLSAYSNGGYLVQIEPHASAQRQRFTCAHELGHILFIEAQDLQAARRRRTLHRTGDDVDVDPQEERLCDFVAAELLMPTLAFCTDVDQCPAGASTVRSLATRYNVSLRAAARRIVDVSRLRQVICLFDREGGSWNLRWLEGPPGAVSEGIAIAPTSRLAQMFGRGEAFRGLFTLSFGPVADEFPIDSVSFGVDDKKRMLLRVFLRNRHSGVDPRDLVLKSHWRTPASTAEESQ